MVNEARLILRRWMNRPVGVAATIVSLALAMGVVAAAWTLVDAILLRPFPYTDATRLAYVWGSTDERIHRGLTTEAIDALASSRAFESMSLFLPAVRLTVGLDPRNTALAVQTDGTFLRVLGVKPLLGRGLREEVPPLDEQEVLLSYGAWRSLFGGRSDIVGAQVIVDGAERTVVGVMPRGFFFPDPTVPLWMPHRRDQRAGSPGQMMFLAVVRLAPGRALASAKAEMAAVLSAAARKPKSGPAIGIFPLTNVAVRDYARAVWSLAGASISLLLLVVANVTTLQLTGMHRRRSELAVRSALGATPGRLLREVLIEQAMTTVAAGLLGLSVAELCLALVRRVQFLDGSRVQDAGIGMFTGGVLIVLALVVIPVATFPGRKAVRTAPAGSLLSGDSLGGGRAPASGLRSVVLFELAVAPPLLLAGSMFFSSFAQAVTTDWGFRPSGAALVEVRFPLDIARRLQRQVDLTEAVMGSIAKQPEVAAVGMGYAAPVQGGGFQRGVAIRIHGRVVGADALIEEHRISHGYFRALGAQVFEGREFTEADGAGRDPVAVVNRSCARLLFPNEDPIGREIRLVREAPDLTNVAEPLASELKAVEIAEIPRRIVGVVDDIRMTGVQQRVRPVVYTEYRQQDNGFWYGTLYPIFIIRSRTDGAVPLDRVVGILRAQLSGGEVVRAADLQSLVESSIGTRGALALLSSSGALFTAIAALLAGIGVYALLSETLNRREVEWGVRMALGAGPWTIAGHLAREVLPVLVAGLALGIVASIASSATIRTFVVAGGIERGTWLLAGLALGVTIGAAAASPLRRVLKLDPVRLLRSN